jgi:hypothetical protein
MPGASNAVSLTAPAGNSGLLLPAQAGMPRLWYCVSFCVDGDEDPRWYTRVYYVDLDGSKKNGLWKKYWQRMDTSCEGALYRGFKFQEQRCTETSNFTLTSKLVCMRCAGDCICLRMAVQA